MNKICKTDRAILFSLVLGVWFAGISLWIKPETVNAHQGMSASQVSDFRNAVFWYVMRYCAGRVHSNGDDVQIQCNKDGKYSWNPGWADEYMKGK